MVEHGKMNDGKRRRWIRTAGVATRCTSLVFPRVGMRVTKWDGGGGARTTHDHCRMDMLADDIINGEPCSSSLSLARDHYPNGNLNHSVDRILL